MKELFNTLLGTITKYPVLIFMLCLGALSPGVLAIVLFEWKAFLEMEILKIIILGCSLTIPTINILFLAVRIHEMDKNPYEMQADFIVSLTFNAIIWGLALLGKVINMERTIIEFTNSIIGWLILAIVIIFWNFRKNSKIEN